MIERITNVINKLLINVKSKTVNNVSQDNLINVNNVTMDLKLHLKETVSK